MLLTTVDPRIELFERRLHWIVNSFSLLSLNEWTDTMSAQRTVCKVYVSIISRAMALRFTFVSLFWSLNFLNHNVKWINFEIHEKAQNNAKLWGEPSYVPCIAISVDQVPVKCQLVSTKFSSSRNWHSTEIYFSISSSRRQNSIFLTTSLSVLCWYLKYDLSS